MSISATTTSAQITSKLSSSTLDFSYLTTRHHQPSSVSILAPRSAFKKEDYIAIQNNRNKRKQQAIEQQRQQEEEEDEFGSDDNNKNDENRIITKSMHNGDTKNGNSKYYMREEDNGIVLSSYQTRPDDSYVYVEEYSSNDDPYSNNTKNNVNNASNKHNNKYYNDFLEQKDYNQYIEGDIDISAKKVQKQKYQQEIKERLEVLNLTRMLLQQEEENEKASHEDRILWECERKKLEYFLLPKEYHEVLLDDWERNIHWDGVPVVEGRKNVMMVSDDDDEELTTGQELLQEVFDPKLECMDFSKDILWDGVETSNIIAIILKHSKLILNPNIAASSISRLILPSIRPDPFIQSEAYERRYEREMSSTCISTATCPGMPNSLNPDSEQMEFVIAARQAKRAQMAIDKSHRVTEAMGTLALGGGKGRTITSSLMGPGGTERTGRPSRHAGSSSAHDAEIVEQLEIVYNHALVKPDLKKSELRQFHRPRLSKALVRIDKPWVFHMRVKLSPHKKIGAKGTATTGSTADGTVTATSASTNAANTSGANMNARNKIRSEADLSTTVLDGSSLVLFEYCEERPPTQLSKGMACRIVNYYRGDKTKCPISAGGGDRPVRKREGSSKNDSNANTANTIKANERPPRLQLSSTYSKSSSANLVTELVGIDYEKQAAQRKKNKKKQKNSSSGPSVETIPEGVTEILHSKVHGPFIGEVEEGTTQSGLISNLFAAPVFCHVAQPTDFLMTLEKPRHHSNVNHHGIPVIVRSLPKSLLTVGQTEPRIKIFAPNTTGEKNFTAPFITYQIAKALDRTQKRENRGLRFDEINDRLFANTVILPNALRQRIKQVALYDKNTQIWTTKPVGMEEYPGVEALGRRFTPEGVAAYESACAVVRRMCDLGIHELHSGSSSVTAVGQAMIYLNGAATASRERRSKISKMSDYAKKNINGNMSSSSMKKQLMLTALYEKSAQKLDAAYREIRRKQEVARFIYEELCLAPWHLTSEFIEVHKNAQGTAMMRLTGLGDPSGRGEGYNFLREVDTKPNKTTNNTDGALNAQIKKITGTENDLRKLTMKQMAALLKSYGMGHKEIDTLKRWDRVHVIRDLSTKAASDGMGDGLERYARGEKMKLSDQKQMYRERIQEIWRRQREALSSTHDLGGITTRATGASAAMDASSTTASTGKSTDGAGLSTKASLSAKSSDSAKKSANSTNNSAAAAASVNNNALNDPMSSDSDSDDDDDLAAALEEDMLNVRQTNQLVSDHVATSDAVAGNTQDLSKDARELAALMRQREEERAAQEDLLAKGTGSAGTYSEKNKDSGDASIGGGSVMKRKVIRRRITKTFPDGTQTTTFKFIVREEEVDKILAIRQKKQDKEAAREDSRKKSYKSTTIKKKTNDTDLLAAATGSTAVTVYHADSRTVGHAMFEDDDDDNPRSGSNRPKIALQLQRSTRVGSTKVNNRGRNAGSSGGSILSMPKAPPKLSSSNSIKSPPKLQLSKLKEKVSQEKKMKKRLREAEEADLYTTASKRKGTSNRRERGAARDRMPHVILSDRLEAIRSDVEKRPFSGPFHRPVNRRILPNYYEAISAPIDLQTIRDKNQRYEYRTVEAFIKEFELMRNNAIKYNGVGSILGDEATGIHDSVKLQVEQSRADFTKFEEAVREQLNGNRSKKLKNENTASDATFASRGNGGGSQSSAVSMANFVVDGVETTVNIGNLAPLAALAVNSDSDDSDATPIAL